MKNYLLALVTLIVAAVIISSCVRNNEWETPPINCNNKFEAPTMSMAAFAAMAPASTVTPTIVIPTAGPPVIFDAYVVSSDENGNFYKTISFQDKPENPTVGLQMEVDRASNYADFPVGSHIRIKANGLVLGTDRGVVKIGAVDPAYSIGRIPGVLFSRYIAGVCKEGMMDIVPIKPTQLSNIADAQNPKYINTLVNVKNLQFRMADLGKTYLDYLAGSGVDTERGLEDKFGNRVALRNSAFFTSGKAEIPAKSGDVTFVVSRYLSTYQMLIRSLKDVNFEEGRQILDIETFESYNIGIVNFSPKYSNTSVKGNRKWTIKSFGNNKYIQISGLNAGLIKTQFAVPVNFSVKKNLTFKTNAGYYNGEVLNVFYSKDYNPANPNTASYTNITAQFDISKGKVPPGAGANYEANFRPSGLGNIPTNVTGNGYIIFEYNSNSSNGSGVSTVMQVDDINIF